MFLHPIITHFPLALLTVYSVFELIRFKKVTEKPYWFFVKAIFVTLGTITAVLAWLTGPEVSGSRLGEMHELFATNSLLIFAIIALTYFSTWCWPILVSKFIMRSYIIIPLALLGLICIVITGSLGGAMVYGTDFDPLMAPVFKLLKIY